MRVLEEQGHRARRLEIAGGHRLPVPGEADDDPADPGLEIGEIVRQGQDRHDLAAGHDDEAILAHRARVDPAQADHHRAQGAVVHVQVRGQVIRRGSSPSALPWCMWLSSIAASRLCAEVMAWKSPVKCRLISSIGTTWA